MQELVEYMKTCIVRYEKFTKDANERAITAINHADYWAAMTAINDAAAYKACIDELRHQIDVVEVTYND